MYDIHFVYTNFQMYMQWCEVARVGTNVVMGWTPPGVMFFLRKICFKGILGGGQEAPVN